MLLIVLQLIFVHCWRDENLESADVTYSVIIDSAEHQVDSRDRYCCSGYCIDLLRHLAASCNFTYSLWLSPPGYEYGAIERDNATGKQRWTGLIGELVEERADLIAAPLTINPERAQVMDFSKPFKYQGITILQKRVRRGTARRRRKHYVNRVPSLIIPT